MQEDKKDPIQATIQEVKEQEKEFKKNRTGKRIAGVVKKRKKVTKDPDLNRIKSKKITADTIHRELLKTNRLGGREISIKSIAKTPAQKALLQQILRKHSIDEDSIAETMLELKENPDYKAKESYIDRAVKYLGYEFKENAAPMQQNNIVIMPPELIKKYKTGNNLSEDDFIDGDIVAE